MKIATRGSVVVAIAVLALAACGDDDSSSTETVADTTMTATMDTVAADTTAETTIDTTVDTTAEAVTADTQAPDTTAAAALPPVKVLAVALGAGGSEAFVTVDKKPEGWDTFNVSMSAEGIPSERVTVVDVQSTASGVIVIVDAGKFFGVKPLNVAVSWTNAAGEKSEIASFACAAGITRSGC